MAEDSSAKAQQPSSRRLPPYPLTVAANATDKQTVTLAPAACSLVVALSAPANVTALVITAAGSGAVLATYAVAPTRSYLIVPVAPAIDAQVTVSVTCGGGGPCSVNVAESYTPLAEQLV